MLERARLLHEAALTGQAVADVEVSAAETLRRAETAAADAAVLVGVLLTIIHLLQGPFLTAVAGEESTVRADDPGGDPGGPPAVAGATRAAVAVRTDDALARLAAVREVQVMAARLVAEIELMVRGGEPAAASGHVLALARLSGLLQHHGDQVMVLQCRISGQALGPYVGELAPWTGPAARTPAAGEEPLDRALWRGRGSKGRRSTRPYAAGALGLALVSAAAGALLAAGRVPAGDATPGAPPRVNITLLMPTPGGVPPSGTSAGPPSAATPTPGSPRPGKRMPLAGGGTPNRTAPTDRTPAPAPTQASPSVPVGTARPGPGRPSAPPLPDGLFRLTDVASRMCLSAPRGSDIPAAGMVQTTCTPDGEQFWRLTPETGGPGGAVYSMRNRFSGLCLSVDAARTTDDAIVTQYPCGDESGLFPDQFWSFHYRPSHRAWQLVNRNSGKCVAIRPGGPDLEQALQSACSDDPWMLWRP
ncbi:RICIN domain-containing protein [Streptomyces sp. NPDC094049]|uniref:RICIN domain-containing protein n=1 Tax=Streptomyces sp. NPDC094049 TaxID=3154987 RepID=UPI00331AD50B